MAGAATPTIAVSCPPTFGLTPLRQLRQPRGGSPQRSRAPDAVPRECARCSPIRHEGSVALPAFCDGAERSACSLERVADGGWIPAAPALGGGDAIGVESARDRGQALAGRPLAPDPLERVLGHLRRPAEPHALRALRRERRLRPLGDRAPLAAGEAGEHARARLRGRRRWLRGAVERDQGPALPLCAREQGGELAQRLVEPLALGGDEHVRLAALERPQRLLEAGSVPLLRREAGRVDRLEHSPAAPPAGCRQRPSLPLAAGAALGLALAAHPRAREPAELVPARPRRRR